MNQTISLGDQQVHLVGESKIWGPCKLTLENGTWHLVVGDQIDIISNQHPAHTKSFMLSQLYTAQQPTSVRNRDFGFDRFVKDAAELLTIAHLYGL